MNTKPKRQQSYCRECGVTAQEAFLERIKGTPDYICDECAEYGVSEDDYYTQKMSKQKAQDDYEMEY